MEPEDKKQSRKPKTANQQTKNFDQTQTDFDVIIIGAGSAGIGAAITLQEKSKANYVILEARDRIGGRIYSQPVADKHQDLGASWIHNYCKQNPYHALVKKHKIELGKAFPQEVEWFDADAEKYNQELHCQARYLYDEMVYFATKRARSQRGLQMSMWEGIQQSFEESAKKEKNIERYLYYCMFMTEHYEAASLKELDVFYDQHYGSHQGDASPLPSYYHMLLKISQNLNIRKNHVVKAIDYRDRVVVQLQDGRQLTSRAVIVTLPLGVLKAKIVQFKPELPASHLTAIDKLGFGLMNKIFVQYDVRFWKGQIRIVNSINGKIPWLLDRSSDKANILMCFVTADYARSLAYKTDEQILKEVDDVLRKVYGEKCGKLLGGKVTHWQDEPYSLGSYSFFKKGSNPTHCEALSMPLDKKIYFAGQHIYAEHIGTAYGAYKTGQKAADNFLLG